MSKVGTREEETVTGEDGFTKDYWASNYSDPESMDCIGNVKEHFAYLYSLFNLSIFNILTACLGYTPMPSENAHLLLRLMDYENHSCQESMIYYL